MAPSPSLVPTDPSLARTQINESDHPGSFWSQIQSWCHRHDIDKSPIDYVQDHSISWLNTELINGSIAAIYGGNLNATWSADGQGGSYALGPCAIDRSRLH